MNKALVIYDSTGRIWSIVYGEETAPQGLTCMFVDIPDGASLSHIDVTDPANPKAVFDYLPESDIGKLQKQVKEMEEKVTEVGQNNEAVALAATFAAESFTDEQALQVPSLYQEWSGEGISYKINTRLRHGNILYKVLQDHTSQPDWTPTAAPSLFACVLIEDPNTIPEWIQPDSTNGYMTGDKVIHNEKTWESLVNNNVWEPGVTGTESAWKEVTAE